MNPIFKKAFLPLIILILSFNFNSFADNSNNFSVEYPQIIIAKVSHTIKIKANADLLNQIKTDSSHILINGINMPYEIEESDLIVNYKFRHKEIVKIQIGELIQSTEINPIPLWLSIFPPLIAILMALSFKEVFSALFVGLFSGTLIIYSYKGSSIFIAFFKAIFAISDTYIINSVNDSGHISIIVFSMLIGSMVTLISKNGGMQGIVNILSRYANTAKSGQLVTWFLGVLIFFDDYANTLVVGNTMRPVTDRLKVSREKLAYIVDSTAAPVASVAMITTWIGIELSYIQSATVQIGVTESPYNIFLNSLPSRFYPFFTLAFMLFLIYKGKDFGPMLKAEKLARQNHLTKQDPNIQKPNGDNELEMAANVTPRWYNAGIPILIVILGTLGGLLYTGWDAAMWADTSLGFSKKLANVIGASDSYQALLWSSLSAVLAAVALSIGQRILSLQETTESLLTGFKTMLTAILILVLAWALADITKDLHTADFISNALISINVAPQILPALTFILSALIAFSTGSSWGTMAILYPLILPASWYLSHSAGMSDEASMNIFYIVVSAILAGSVLGDHCSPISDTTILSSLASSCNHIEHVRTQLPYALTVGSISIFIGLIPAAYGVSYWIIFPVGLISLYSIVHFFGKKVEE
ncbi:Na+/H+ antiporter NhaC family protein [Ancylomarina euxinus]|uniref:Na+/H+ antiporter NhaC family protein n=1 Tax=Ancylomarina euxinus TaxID=2283627 RepID=A0A425Y6B2_9BACT|nr:Na+/H+ antiporter NhaC family protein [Ancylomarina euxinus]MCZ4694134.1 Na+/H+ antiporter NhaC family protein [Ancylomarina euxinus]MUP15800.1 Na+/H+ antiporter NhaC family protein [Ancylomarina euxinus]RRG23996.1 Na+/H+ antiporter NhaC family protein [Ancylomarina euxinus]